MKEVLHNYFTTQERIIPTEVGRVESLKLIKEIFFQIKEEYIKEIFKKDTEFESEDNYNTMVIANSLKDKKQVGFYKKRDDIITRVITKGKIFLFSPLSIENLKRTLSYRESAIQKKVNQGIKKLKQSASLKLAPIGFGF